LSAASSLASTTSDTHLGAVDDEFSSVPITLYVGLGGAPSYHTDRPVCVLRVQGRARERLPGSGMLTDKHNSSESLMRVPCALWSGGDGYAWNNVRTGAVCSLFGRQWMVP